MQVIKHPKLIMPVLMLLVGFGPLSLELYLPALSSIVQSLHTTIQQVQLTITLFPIGYGIAQLFLGPLSDYCGRKTVLFIGGVVFLLATIGCCLAAKVQWLMLFRILQGVGACCGPLMARAMIRDLYDPKHSSKILSVVASVMGFAPAIGPIIGGYLTHWFGWRSNFIFMFLFAAMALWLAHYTFFETNTHHKTNRLSVTHLMGHYKIVAKNKHFLLYCLSLCLFYGGFFSFITQSPLLFYDFYHIGPNQFGHYFAIVVVAYALGSLCVSRVTHHFAISSICIMAACIGLLAGGLLFILSSMIVNCLTLFLPACLYAFATGVILPAGIAGAMQFLGKQAGTASGLLGFMQMLFATCIASLLAFSYHKTLFCVAICFTVTAGIATLIIMLEKINNKRRLFIERL